MATPIPFLTAVWAGMSHGDILAGLRNGDIVRPGRLPDWATGLDQRPGAPAANSDPPTAVDRARVSAWFTSLDPDLSSSAFQVNWNRVGTNDSDRATKLTSYLSNLPLRDGSSGASGDAVAGPGCVPRGWNTSRQDRRSVGQEPSRARDAGQDRHRLSLRARASRPLHSDRN